jgi:hypothetical protein
MKAHSQEAIFKNTVVHHEADWLPEAPEEKTVYIRGEAISKFEAVCQMAGKDEVQGIWGGTIVNGAIPIIDGVWIPYQEVNGVWNQVTGADLARCAREIRRRARVSFGACHSHADFAVYSSGTDSSQSRRIAEIGGGVPMPPPDMMAKGLKALGAEGGESRRTAPGTHRQCGLFSTHNRANGDKGNEHWFAGWIRTWCPFCESIHWEWGGQNITVHVIGPIEHSQEEEDALRKTFDERVRPLTVNSTVLRPVPPRQLTTSINSKMTLATADGEPGYWTVPSPQGTDYIIPADAMRQLIENGALGEWIPLEEQHDVQ